MALAIYFSAGHPAINTGQLTPIFAAPWTILARILGGPLHLQRMDHLPHRLHTRN